MTRPRNGDGKRQLILDFVSRRPGAHKSRMCRELKLAWGTVSHHLMVLERDGRIRFDCANKKQRYFPATTSSAQMDWLAALATDQAQKVIDALRGRPGATTGDLVRALGLSRRLVRKQLVSLERVDLVCHEGDVHRRYWLQPHEAFRVTGGSAAHATFDAPSAPATLTG